MESDKTNAFAYEKVEALEAIAHLFYALHQAGVRYCHWKSNMRLEWGLNGRTDLDLLVDPQHGPMFRQILSEHHIKPLLAAPGKDYPGIESYLGFDPSSGKLFHLHVHYQLVLGEQYVKNYHLPLEEQFFESVCIPQGILVPAPTMELIILSLRALLKYRDRDVIKDIFAIRTPGLPAHIREEIEWLWHQTSPEQVSEALVRVAHVIPSEAVAAFLHTVLKTPRNGWQLFRLRGQVRRGLRPYQRQSRFQASLAYFRQLWRQRQPARKMTLSDGGRTIALIGADGAGKSTMCQLLCEWLAWKLDVHFYYLGSKQPSQRSRFIYMLFRMARRSQQTVANWLGEKSLPARWLTQLRQSLLYSHHVSIGRDRLQRYWDSREMAKTAIVIYDRYPLAAPLDGPKIHLNGHATRVDRLLVDAEQAVYRQMELPRHFLFLKVSPEISLQRKPDHDPAAIAGKAQFLDQFAAQFAVREKTFSQTNLTTINANQPFNEVVRQLKTAVWQLL